MLKSIVATIQDSQVGEGWFISLFPTKEDMHALGMAPMHFYLMEKGGLQDLRICGELLDKLDWLKGAIEFIQMLQKR